MREVIHAGNDVNPPVLATTETLTRHVNLNYFSEAVSWEGEARLTDVDSWRITGNSEVVPDLSIISGQSFESDLYATEMLRAGVSFPALMKLLGHTSPEMTMQYLDVILTDLQREFELAHSKPRHRVPEPKVPSAALRSGFNGVLDSLRTAQHMLEMFGRTLPNTASRRQLRRLSNRLSKILCEARSLTTP